MYILPSTKLQGMTIELYSVIKKKKTMLFTGKWMELENIRLSEVSQAQIVKCLMFSLIGRNQIYMLNVYNKYI
jgi:hypothetical protein